MFLSFKAKERTLYDILALGEEIQLRAVPSATLSMYEGREEPHVDLFIGTEGAKMNKHELIVGIITSILFGYLHNITPSGFDKKVISAPQILWGMTFWYLQRKFGFASNSLAHILYNHRVTS